MIVKTIGRGQENNIVVNDNKISRVHSQLIQDDNGNISVVDLNSTNGTYVNGKRISAEIHLKAGDELRIGDTVLPWRDYFNAPPKPQPPTQQSPTQKPTTKQGKKLLYVIGGIIVALLIAGGIVLYLNSDKNLEIEQVDNEKEQMKRLLNATEEDYDNLRNLNEETKKQMEEQRKSFEESKKADSLARAKKDEALRIEKQKAKKEKDAAVASAKEQAEKDKAKAVDAAKAKAKAAEEAKEKAEKQAKEKIEEEQKAKKEAIKETELTKQFYEELQKAADKNHLDKVCKALFGKDVSKNKRYPEIVKKFNSAKTNKERQEIIDTIKDAK